MEAERLVKKLDEFIVRWQLTPRAISQFVGLVQEIHDMPTHDHANEPLLNWIDEEWD